MPTSYNKTDNILISTCSNVLLVIVLALALALVIVLGAIAMKIIIPVNAGHGEWNSTFSAPLFFQAKPSFYRKKAVVPNVEF